MGDTGIPPLYDEERGLRELARHRLKRDSLTRVQVRFGDSLAEYMQQHFAAEETETAGRALLIAASVSAGLVADGVSPPEVIVNILGYAAARLISDGRAWLGSQDGDRDG